MPDKRVPQDFGSVEVGSKESNLITGSLCAIPIASLLAMLIALLGDHPSSAYLRQGYEFAFRGGGPLSPEEIVLSTGQICGFIVGCGYMLYLMMYYFKIWATYFSLSDCSDLPKMFIYILLIAVYFGSLFFAPDLWFAFILALLVIMLLLVKRPRSKAYIHSFHREYYDPDKLQKDVWDDLVKQKENRVLFAKYYLAKSLSRNFSLGICLNMIPFTALAMSYFLTNFTNHVDFGCGGYFFSACMYMLFSVLFFLYKILAGLDKMIDRVEQGDYAYFESFLR